MQPTLVLFDYEQVNAKNYLPEIKLTVSKFSNQEVKIFNSGVLYLKNAFVPQHFSQDIKFHIDISGG
jgi:hypothetical protein